MKRNLPYNYHQSKTDFQECPIFSLRKINTKYSIYLKNNQEPNLIKLQHTTLSLFFKINIVCYIGLIFDF